MGTGGEKHPRIVSSCDSDEPADAGKGWCRKCVERDEPADADPCCRCVLGSFYMPSEYMRDEGVA